MKKKKKPIVYCGMTGDIVHHGHINILKVASGYGDVILGLLTDKAVSTYKKKTTLKYNNRKIVLQSIKYVKKIIPQKTLDYTQNLKKLKPNYVVHGSDWKNGVQKNTRNQVIKLLKKWNGKLIEPKYTKNISSTLIKKKLKI
jgi:phosphoenolpyruvate phosphomutase / 2-hydroxyethylphosphonate cytidylyltransferase|tara:strand:- start:9740 stop:10165 length:426 start_codon:yes stop_codon:yes gene_type:complete